MDTLWRNSMSEKIFGVWCAPIRHISRCRKFCNRRFFAPNSRFLGLKVVPKTMTSPKGQNFFWKMFGHHLGPKKILGCVAHPQSDFRPSENSTNKLYLGEIATFTDFTSLGKVSYMVQLRNIRFSKANGLREHPRVDKRVCVCAYTRHTHSGSQLS